MAIYAVGDIQGCFEPLIKLLDKVNFDPSRDRLWAVGDLVNRGPQSLETLRFLKSLGNAFTAVLGNHDLHLLALAYGAFNQGKKESLLTLLNAPDCEELCEWLRFLPLLHREIIMTEQGSEEFVMVHAGIEQSWSINQAESYAKEVELVLQGKNHFQLLAEIYGNEPSLWRSNLEGMERLRLIINILTRMRYCNAQGKLDLTNKSNNGTQPAGYKPWFEYLKLKPQTTLIFGHWASLEGITNKANIHALDTGYVWGRALTAMRLEDKKLFKVDHQETN